MSNNSQISSLVKCSCNHSVRCWAVIGFSSTGFAVPKMLPIRALYACSLALLLFSIVILLLHRSVTFFRFSPYLYRQEKTLAVFDKGSFLLGKLLCCYPFDSGAKKIIVISRHAFIEIFVYFFLRYSCLTHCVRHSSHNCDCVAVLSYKRYNDFRILWCIHAYEFFWNFGFSFLFSLGT